jgi:uncharacterized protein YqhQ
MYVMLAVIVHFMQISKVFFYFGAQDEVVKCAGNGATELSPKQHICNWQYYILRL